MKFTTELKMYLFLILVWAGIYLPSLGVLEINFDEHKRAIPALTMMESGDWVVPKLAGKKYFNKPPLINWLIAASFKATGEKSEFTARLPSVLFILLFVSVLFWTDFKKITIEGRFIISLIFLTSSVIIQKGRQCEIDAIYTCLTGFSIFLWMNYWSEKNNWSKWILSSVALGLGLLLKGPMILVFYYALVISVLIYTKRTKELFSFQHICGILIFIGIFMAWSIPSSMQMLPSEKAITSTWKQQMLLRFQDNSNVILWFQRAIGSVLAFLPWVIFAPFLWNKKWLDSIEEKDRLFFRACRTGLIIAFLLIVLMPGTRSRYSMPSFALTSILIGWLLSVQKEINFESLWKKILSSLFFLSGLASVLCLGFALKPQILKAMPLPADFSEKLGIFAGSALIPAVLTTFLTLSLAIYFFIAGKKINGVIKLSVMTSLLILIITLQYSFYFTPVLNQFSVSRPSGFAIKNAIPENEEIYAYKIECEHFMFYIPHHINFLYKESDIIGEKVKYLLLIEKDYEEFIAYPNVQKRDPEIILSMSSDGKNYKLLHYKK